MIEVLTLGPNDYRAWLTYEHEYLNDAFAVEPSVSLKTWGRYRPGYVAGLTASEIVERLYGSSRPDLIVIDISRYNSKPDDRKLFDGLQVLSKKAVLIFRCNDPWRFMPVFRELSEKIAPDYWLVPIERFASIYNEHLRSNKGTAYMFPYCIGRRYFNMGLEREYDLGLIGRCEINDKPLRPGNFRFKLKAFHEAALSHVRRKLGEKNYLQRHSALILNLNRCLTSWNSPARIKGAEGYHIPFRYVEAPACGAVSIVPFDHPDLNKYYFPKDTYLNCEGSLQRAVELIKNLRQDTGTLLDIQARAYRHVMGNHVAGNRVKFMISLFNGAVREGMDVRDYYSVTF